MGMVLVSFIHNPDMSKKKKIQHIDYVSRGKICEILLETKPDSYLFYVWGHPIIHCLTDVFLW